MVVFGLISLSLPRWICLTFKNFGHLYYFPIFFILSNKMEQFFQIKNFNRLVRYASCNSQGTVIIASGGCEVATTWNTPVSTFIAQWRALYFRFASRWNAITTLACWSWAQHSVAGGFPPQTFGTVCIAIAWHKIFWVPRWIWNQIWNYQNALFE